MTQSNGIHDKFTGVKKYFKKVLNKTNAIVLLLIILTPFIFISPRNVYAATTPNLGAAASFSILSGTYSNTAGGTTINGDLGYTTGPAMAPTVNGTIYSPPSSKYSTAGSDQVVALANLNSQACTFTFAPGAVDLAIDTTHGPIGVYAPGVYCMTGAASIGTGGIILSGNGTYIFRIQGALNTVANSKVTLDGASSCDVFWTPSAATTLGANSTFAGTDIDATGITIGSTITWLGKALAFGGTVSTTTDTITAPTCAGNPSPSISPSITNSPTPTLAVSSPTPTRKLSPSPTRIPTPTCTPKLPSPTPTRKPTPTPKPPTPTPGKPISCTIVNPLYWGKK